MAFALFHRSIYKAVHKCSILVAFVHLKHVIGRCLYDFSTFSQDHCLEYVYYLGDVCHRDAVTVTVEDIQVQCRYHGIPHRILLIQESRIRPLFYLEPGAPLVHDQFNLVLRIVFAHDLQMAVDHLLNAQSQVNGLIVFLRIKLRRLAFLLPATGHGIIVQADSIGKTVADNTHEFIRPLIVGPVRSAGDLIQLIVAVIPAVSLVSAVNIRIVIRRHIAAAAPVLIANAKVIHLPRFLMAILFAQLRHRGNPVEGHVLYPL